MWLYGLHYIILWYIIWAKWYGLYYIGYIRQDVKLKDNMADEMAFMRYFNLSGLHYLFRSKPNLPDYARPKTAQN